MSLTLSRTIEHNSKFVLYDIKPENQQDLPSALNRATPNGSYHASAYWTLRWTYQYEQVNGQCQIASANVILNTDMLMPKLADDFIVDTQTRITFEEYYHNLLTHEYGHLDFGVLAANEVEALLLDKTQMANCEDLGTASNLKARSAITQFAQKDDEYDADTQHGRTQGAYIFDLF